MDFDRAFDELIDHEKGFQDDPRDRGNWTSGVVGKGECKGTKYGISAMAYPQLDIKNLTLGQAKAIYRRDYWDVMELDLLPEEIRFDMFDTAVNSGVGTSARILQRAVGVKDDGKIGPRTLAAVGTYTPEQLDSRLAGYRILYLCGAKTYEHFGKGWMVRVANNLIKD